MGDCRGAQIWVLGQTDRVDQHLSMPLWLWRQRWPGTSPGPGRYSGQGEGLPCPGAPGLAWAGLTLPGPPQSVCFTLGPDPEVETGPDCGLEVAEGPKMASRPSGSFCPRFSAHSGGMTRPQESVGGLLGRRAGGSPWGLAARGVSWHTCFFFVKVLMGPGRWMDRTLPAGGWEGRADPSAMPS